MSNSITVTGRSFYCPIYLARTGGKKGDLSRFVDDAVLARLFELTVEDVKERNRAQSQEEILEAIEEALAG